MESKLVVEMRDVEEKMPWKEFSEVANHDEARTVIAEAKAFDRRHDMQCKYQVVRITREVIIV